MSRSFRDVGVIIAAAAAVAWATQAQAEVVNGGFETGSFSGWTQTGDTSFSGVDAFAARSGSFGAFFGPVNAVGGISQSFATLAGTPYQVSFSLALASGDTPNSFSWSWNGVTQTPVLTNSGLFGYTNFSSLVAAAGSSSTIAFNFSNPQSFYLLDNVSVAAIPEPPEVALMVAGLLLVVRRLKGRRDDKVGHEVHA